MAEYEITYSDLELLERAFKDISGIELRSGHGVSAKFCKKLCATLQDLFELYQLGRTEKEAA